MSKVEKTVEGPIPTTLVPRGLTLGNPHFWKNKWGTSVSRIGDERAVKISYAAVEVIFSAF